MKLRPTVAARIARAIVHVAERGGLGVLVPGGFVVTAAHCIGWTAKGLMALEAPFRETIVTADGRELVVAPVVVEPVSDLAVLGAMDGQAFPDAADAFEAFCGATRPVPLAMDKLVTFVSHPAYVFTHDQGVLEAAVQLTAAAASSLWLHSEQHINRGTSGGPVVTGAGRLLGIISNSGSVNGVGPCDGQIPRVHLAAPAWVVRQMIPGRTRRALDAVLPPGRLRLPKKRR